VTIGYICDLLLLILDRLIGGFAAGLLTEGLCLRGAYACNTDNATVVTAAATTGSCNVKSILFIVLWVCYFVF